MKYFLPIAFLVYSLSACSQKAVSYEEQIAQHRAHYKQEFVTEESSPLTAADTAYLHFFDADEKYKVTAQVTITPDAPAFDMLTVSGKTKKYRQYALATFTINDTTCTLQILQSLKLIKQEKYKNSLFIPFTDATIYTLSYGGGRYIDLSSTDIKDNTIVIDFNKCYNPWCAYADGYSCPIPPPENILPVAIPVGEKMYGKEVKH